MQGEYRWQVIAGQSWTLEGLRSGGSLLFHRNVEGRAVTATVTVPSSGTATWATPDVAATVYVAYRSSSSESYRRLGVIDVESLIDETEERLRVEVQDLDRRILALESGHVQVQGPDGMGLTRVALPGLRKQRANAAARLYDYQRRKAGMQPVRMV